MIYSIAKFITSSLELLLGQRKKVEVAFRQVRILPNLLLADGIYVL